MPRGLRAPSSIFLFAIGWLCLACGRVGLELTPLDSGIPGDPPDADVDVPRDPDAGVPSDADVPSRDAQGTEDAGPSIPCQGSCRNEHGTTECRDEQCVPDCANDYLDCDGNPQNGCETSVSDQTATCGSCSVVCTNPGGSTGCDAGTCAPVCTAASADCDDDPRNGCETTLATSTEHCGGCDVACTNPPGQGTSRCLLGMCTPECTTGYADCDGNRQNGCETNANTDPAHCGGCNRPCVGNNTCVGGVCTPNLCGAGTANCDNDAANTCETTLTNNVNNCGACSRVCAYPSANPQCSGTTCGIASCRAGFANCDNQLPNGCEINTNTAVAHCGGCGMACINPHGTLSCVNGGCAPGCSTGWGSCDDNGRNGCETQLNSLTHCGGCGTACTTAVANATADCSTGACVARCNLSGVWALRIRVATTWPSGGFVSGGSGNQDYVARVVLTQSGTTLSGTTTPCGREVPPFDNSVTADRYDVVFPTTLFDRSFSGNGLSLTLGGLAAGASVAGARAALTLGIALANPITDAWPGLAAARTAGAGAGDQDGDGNPGVTANYANGGGYSYPQTDGTLFAPRADRGYIAERLRYTLAGTLSSCTQASGNANAEAIDTHTVGCRLNGSSGNCDYQHLDSNAPDYRVSSSSYTLVRVAAPGANVTCAMVRAALP